MQTVPAPPREDASPHHRKSVDELRIENEHLRTLVVQLSSIVARHAAQRP